MGKWIGSEERILDSEKASFDKGFHGVPGPPHVAGKARGRRLRITYRFCFAAGSQIECDSLVCSAILSERDSGIVGCGLSHREIISKLQNHGQAAGLFVTQVDAFPLEVNEG